MKKLLSTLLCIVLVCFTFVGCGKDVIGEYLPNYELDNKSDDKIETLNFYIITGESTSPEAKITVPQNINSYLKEKYDLELNIVYWSYDAEKPENTYEALVNAALSENDESKRPDVILINSENMFNTLYKDNKLVGLDKFYEGDYKGINALLDSALLEASKVVEGDVTENAAPRRRAKKKEENQELFPF